MCRQPVLIYAPLESHCSPVLFVANREYAHRASSFNTPMICSSVNRSTFIVRFFQSELELHTGLNAGVRSKVVIRV